MAAETRCGRNAALVRARVCGFLFNVSYLFHTPSPLLPGRAQRHTFVLQRVALCAYFSTRRESYGLASKPRTRVRLLKRSPPFTSTPASYSKIVTLRGGAYKATNAHADRDDDCQALSCESASATTLVRVNHEPDLPVVLQRCNICPDSSGLRTHRWQCVNMPSS